MPTTFPSAKAGSDLTVRLTASGKSTVCAPVDLDFSGFSDMYLPFGGAYWKQRASRPITAMWAG